MTLNGSLAGLVAITAGCDMVDPFGAASSLALIAGFVVVFGIEFIDKKLKVDDPVGAVGVHGLCGATGTLLTGLFAVDGGRVLWRRTLPFLRCTGAGRRKRNRLGSRYHDYRLLPSSKRPSACAYPQKKKSSVWISKSMAWPAAMRTSCPPPAPAQGLLRWNRPFL